MENALFWYGNEKETVLHLSIITSKEGTLSSGFCVFFFSFSAFSVNLTMFRYVYLYPIINQQIIVNTWAGFT